MCRDAAQFQSGLSFLSAEETRSAADFIQRFSQSRYALAVKEGLRRSLSYRVRTNQATEEERALFQRLFFDTVAPTLSVVASPTNLWPPSHRLVPVSVSVQVSDDKDASPSIKLLSITCDDQCDPALDIVGPGYGTDLRQFQLRSERRGTSTTGRTYTVTYSATDASGNSTTATNDRESAARPEQETVAARAPTIAILPTTRWKPPRAIDPVDSLAPIKVNFKGPNDLDPATVEVKSSTSSVPSTAVTIAGSDDREFQLRSERKGTSIAGRTYMITYSATGASRNSTTATTTVSVPHDQGKKK